MPNLQSICGGSDSLNHIKPANSDYDGALIKNRGNIYACLYNGGDYILASHSIGDDTRAQGYLFPNLSLIDYMMFMLQSSSRYASETIDMAIYEIDSNGFITEKFRKTYTDEGPHVDFLTFNPDPLCSYAVWVKSTTGLPYHLIFS